MFEILFLGGNGVRTLHHDLAHSWLGIPWGLHKHKLQNPTNTNSPGVHVPIIDKIFILKLLIPSMTKVDCFSYSSTLSSFDFIT